jgi:5-hydroxyisourate hydrolase-like protein (transthyretin family)
LQVAFVLLFWLAFLPQDQTQPKCSLSGAVVDSATGKPLAKVELRLEPLAGDWASTTNSGDNGRFALADLEPGRYHLVAIRSGYLQMAYGSHGSARSGTILKLEAGQDLADLRFELTPAGSIAGTIRDNDGEPIEYADVALHRIIYTNRGQPHLERVGGALSNDRGEYRIHGLEPGKY